MRISLFVSIMVSTLLAQSVNASLPDTSGGIPSLNATQLAAIPNLEQLIDNFKLLRDEAHGLIKRPGEAEATPGPTNFDALIKPLLNGVDASGWGTERISTEIATNIPLYNKLNNRLGFIRNIPDEVIVTVLNFLNSKDLHSCRGVSNQIKLLTNEPCFLDQRIEEFLVFKGLQIWGHITEVEVRKAIKDSMQEELSGPSKDFIKAHKIENEQNLKNLLGIYSSREQFIINIFARNIISEASESAQKFIEDHFFTLVEQHDFMNEHGIKTEQGFKDLMIDGLNINYFNLRTELLNLPLETIYFEYPKTIFSSTFLPGEIGRLEHLVTLNLCHQSFITLPDSLRKLVNLKLLLLSITRMRTLPAIIGELDKLENLFLFGNNPGLILPLKLNAIPNLRTLTFNGFEGGATLSALELAKLRPTTLVTYQ